MTALRIWLGIVLAATIGLAVAAHYGYGIEIVTSVRGFLP